MPRMGSAKRIELGQKMVALFAEAGHMGHNNKVVRFVQDMIVRLDSGRAMSPRQRDWYDSAVLESPPTPKNEALVKQLREDAKLVGMEEVKEPLNDFAYKLSRGWNLSEKQVAFMEKLQLKAEAIRVHGHWAPTPEERAAMELGVAFCRRYSGYYMQGQPGLSKSLERFRAWHTGLTPAMDKWSAEKLMTICKGDRARMEDAKTRWPKGGLTETKNGNVPALILEDSHVDENGEVALMVLIDGEPKSFRLEQLVKPRKKRKKKAV